MKNVPLQTRLDECVCARARVCEKQTDRHTDRRSTSFTCKHRGSKLRMTIIHSGLDPLSTREKREDSQPHPSPAALLLLFFLLHSLLSMSTFRRTDMTTPHVGENSGRKPKKMNFSQKIQSSGWSGTELPTFQ